MRVMKLAFLGVIIAIATTLHSSPVDRNKAMQAARTKLIALDMFITYKPKSIESLTSTDAKLLGYVIALSPKGFLLITADTDFPPLMAYSFENEFGNIDGRNPLLDLFLTDIELLSKSKNKLPAHCTQQNNEAWNELLGISEPKGSTSFIQWPPAGSTSTGGYLTANWTQSAPYNNLCPLDVVSGNNRSQAGCPAVAMAQILNFLKTTNDVSFTNTDDYYHNYGGNRYWIDNDAASYGFPTFSVLNDYLRSLQSHYTGGGAITNTEKAALVFACGVAAKQVFAASGSGTFSVNQAFAAYQRFNFTNASLLLPNDSDLYKITAMNIIDSLTVHMATVTPANDAGHNFVVDGYNTENFFHLNFGWGGAYNGWYKIPEGIPYNLTTMEGTIVNLYTGNKRKDLNDEPCEAVVLQPSQAPRVYQISAKDDVDWYKIKLREGTKFLLHTEKFGLFNMPLKVWLYGPVGEADSRLNPMQFTASDDTSFGHDQPGFAIQIKKSGNYYIRIAERNNTPGIRPRGKNIGAYMLFVDTTGADKGDVLHQNLLKVSLQSFPNPCNPTTTISYNICFDGIVTVQVFNILGQKVEDLINGVTTAGYHNVVFNGNGLPSGVYFCSMDAVALDGTEHIHAVKKLILQK